MAFRSCLPLVVSAHNILWSTIFLSKSSSLSFTPFPEYRAIHCDGKDWNLLNNSLLLKSAPFSWTERLVGYSPYFSDVFNIAPLLRTFSAAIRRTRQPCKDRLCLRRTPRHIHATTIRRRCYHRCRCQPCCRTWGVLSASRFGKAIKSFCSTFRIWTRRASYSLNGIKLATTTASASRLCRCCFCA